MNELSPIAQLFLDLGLEQEGVEALDDAWSQSAEALGRIANRITSAALWALQGLYPHAKT